MTSSKEAEFHLEQPMISKIVGSVISLLSFGTVLQSTIIWYLLRIHRECMVWMKRSSSACLASWVTVAWQMLSTWPSSQKRRNSWWRALRPCGAFRRSWPCERRSSPKCSQCHKLQTWVLPVLLLTSNLIAFNHQISPRQSQTFRLQCSLF